MPKEKEEEWRYTSIDKFKLDSYITEEPKTIISVSNEDLGEGVVITDINSALDKYPAAQNYLFKNADYKKTSSLHLTHRILITAFSFTSQKI